MKNQIGLIFCNEKGILENQSILLVDSIIQYLKLDNATIFSCSPRPDYLPSEKILSKMKASGVELICEQLNTKFCAYPIANKMLASKYIEEKYPHFTSLIFIDTDTVFLNQIDQDMLLNGSALYLRPVDNKGPGSTGDDDINDEFWQKVFALCDVQIPEPWVTTTVGNQLIRSYFNAGLVWAKNIHGFFHQWYEDFETIVSSDLRPIAYQSRDGNDFRCLDQVALAVTATRYSEHLEILPETFNYPIPFKPRLNIRPEYPDLSELVHVHYHKWFQHKEFLKHVCNNNETNSEQYQWLQNNLPIRPIIYDKFKC